MKSSAFLTRAERLWQERADRALAYARAEGRLQPAAKRAPTVDERSELDALRERIAELEAEPDPGKAPFRGTSAAGLASPDTERPSALKAAQKRGEDEKTAWLDNLAKNHPDPATRIAAEDTLARRRASS